MNQIHDTDEVSSLAVLLDNARAAITAARDAGLDVQTMGVNPLDHAMVTRSKKFEQRVGLPLRILGVAIEADDDVRVGSVRI